ncbi:MAG TPA: hypothetical protein DDX04_02095 [Massilia sp.]|nr:hypothetical protein [Massilia sp.]
MTNLSTISTMEFADWYENMSPLISNGILKCDTGGAWEENHISFALLDALENGTGEISLNPDYTTSYTIKKVSGDPEEKYGDIIVLVELEVNGNTIEGVGHFEAKRSYKDSPRFKMIDAKQLEIMLKSSPAHSVLLYDIGGDNSNRYGVATAVNTPLVIASKLKSEALHSLGEDFIDKFARYLAGRELDFDSAAVQDAKQAINKGQVVAAILVRTRFSPKLKLGTQKKPKHT